MAKPHSVADESRRLAALGRYRALVPASDPALDELTTLAASLCETPIAMVSLVDTDFQRCVARVGFGLDEVPRDWSFCAHALDAGSVMEVEDAAADSRFTTNPLVTGEPFIRFYAGAPLMTPSGEALGTLCVMDRQIRRLTDRQRQALQVLSRQVMARFELRRQELALAGAEEWLFAVFRSCPVGVAVHRTRDRRFTDANEAFASVVGIPRDEILGRTPDELHLDLSAIAAIRHSVGDRPVAGNVRVTLSARDGRVRELVAGLVRASLRGEPHTIITVFDLTDQHRVEQALAASEERLRLALDAARMGTFDWDIRTGRLTWSRWHEELWGLSPGAFDGTYRTFAGRVHPDDLPGVEAELTRCMATREAFTREFRVVQADGSARWVTGKGEFDFADDGTAVRMRGVVADTTDRHRAEAHVQHLNRAYAVLSDIDQTIVREKDLDAMLQAACRIAVERGGFLMSWIGLVNPATGILMIRAQAGADADTVDILRRMIEFDPPAGCPFTRHALQHGTHGVSDDIATDPEAASCRELALERGYRTMAAFPLTVQGRVLGVFNVYGAEAGWFDAEELQLFDELAADLSYALELHHRDREHEAAIEHRREAEERLRQLAESIQEVFWMSDPATQETLYVSPAYETIWGRSCESLYRSPQGRFEAIHPDDRARVLHALRTRWQTGDFDETYRITRPDGTVRWIRDRAYPVRGIGNAQRIVGTATDITEQRQLEDQLRQSQKMESIGRLAGGIAHDFNNLLTVINGIADLAMLGLQAPDPLRADLEQIRQAGERAAVLTRQLLAVSRQQILRPKILDLSLVVSHTERMLRRLIGEDIAVVLDLAREPGLVRADPGQLEQVLLNLAVNARDAMPDGGTLRVSVANVELDERRATELTLGRAGPHIVLEVSDTGVGMDEPTRQRIFEPFFTTKEVGKGTGLGLSTVYGIVRQSGGVITVESEPGTGATFRIFLPCVDDEIEEESHVETASSTSGRETVLLVEDEAPVRQLTRRILAAAGYAVVEAASGEEALARFADPRVRVDLVLTDVVMPGMTGREMAIRLAAIQPGVKVLYVSGYTDDAILRHGVLEDARRFLAKPYTSSELRRKVRDLLDS